MLLDAIVTSTLSPAGPAVAPPPSTATPVIVLGSASPPTPGPAEADAPVETGGEAAPTPPPPVAATVAAAPRAQVAGPTDALSMTTAEAPEPAAAQPASDPAADSELSGDVVDDASAAPDGRGPAAAPTPGGPAPALAALAAEARPVATIPIAGPTFYEAVLSPAPAWRLTAHEPEGGPAASSSPVAANPRDVAGQITLAVSRASEGQVDVRLDPPELGRVQIRLNPAEGGGLQAIVLADRPETQDFLRRHADALVRDLTEAGYTEVSLEFASGHDAPERDAPPEQRGGLGALEHSSRSTAAGAEAEPQRRTAAGGLDIRL